MIIIAKDWQNVTAIMTVHQCCVKDALPILPNNPTTTEGFLCCVPHYISRFVFKLEDKAATSDKLQKQIDELQLKLKERDASATELKVKHSKEKSDWDSQKLELQAKLSKV